MITFKSPSQEEKLIYHQYGRFKFFHVKSGYGFIIGEDDKEYYCNAEFINDYDRKHPPQTDDPVFFYIWRRGSRTMAVNVTVLNSKDK